MATYEHAATPAPKTTPVPAPREDERKQGRPEDLVPEENKASGDKDDAEAKKAEEERAAAVIAKWEDTLGKWLGGPLAKLVLENVSLADLNEYVQDGLKAVAPGINGLLKDQVKPGTSKEEAALQTFSEGLGGVLTGLIDKFVASPKGQKLLGAISTWVQDNPGWVVGIASAALIGGAIAAFATNQAVDFTVPFSLGKGWEAKAGIDLNKLRALAFQGASIAVANKTAGFSGSVEIKRDVKKDEDGKVTQETKTGALKLAYGKEGAPQTTLALNGKIVDTKDGLVAYTAGGALEFTDPKTGAKVTVKEDGSWDTKGNKKDDFSFSVSGGKEVTGSLSTALSNATVVDQDGNIHSLSSKSLSVAVGSKAGKFSLTAKEETKDGVTSTTQQIDAAGQLTLGRSVIQASSNVAITGDQVTVKLTSGVTTKIGGKDVDISGEYASDGPVTARIKVGEGGTYKEVRGTVKDGVVSLATADVFAGGSVEQAASSDGKHQTTVKADVGKGQQLTATQGSAGSSVGYVGKGLADGAVDVSATAAQDAKGAASLSASGTYKEGDFKASLDALMKEGASSLSLGANYEKDGLKASAGVTLAEGKDPSATAAASYTKDGYVASADLKIDGARIAALSTQLGYRSPDEFKTFLLGYKATYLKEHQAYSHHFDAQLEYALGRWAARATAGIDVMGGRVQKTNLDLGLGYSLNKDWMATGGVQMNATRNMQTGAMDQGFKPWVGAQYKGVNVGVFYDTSNKSAGVMLTIPFGR